MIYNEIIQGNDFSKNLISFESEKYILFDCEIYSEFLYLHKRLRNTEYINRIRDRKIAIKIRWNKNRMKWTFSPSRAQSRTQFELCHGEKTTVENKRTISLSRVQSSLLELPRREMEHENEGIIEAFRGGRRRPRLFVGAGPFTSPECRPDRASDFGNDGLSSLKGLYFFSVRSGSIDCISCDWRFISAIFKSDIFKRLFIL